MNKRKGEKKERWKKMNFPDGLMHVLSSIKLRQGTTF